MLTRRTDLALEAHELLGSAPEGVDCRETWQRGFPLTTVRVENAAGAEALGKPVGVYHTLDLTGVNRREEGAFPRAVGALAELLRPLLPEEGEAVMVVGLGNRAITPDAVGPKAADRTLVTRHLIGMAPEHFGSFRPVAALAAGVLGSTGMESGELVAALVEKTAPACVIAIDALASRSLDRVCRTIQLSDAGIVPGSGVGNARYALNRETLGVPVIALGVPTVVDVATLCADVLAEAGKGDLEPEALRGAGAGLMVTPRDIDQSAADLAKVIGFGVNLALQEGLSVDDVELLLS